MAVECTNGGWGAVLGPLSTDGSRAAGIAVARDGRVSGYAGPGTGLRAARCRARPGPG